MQWLVQNGASLLVLTVVLAVAVLVWVYLCRRKKRSKSPCGGSCEGCSGCAFSAKNLHF